MTLRALPTPLPPDATWLYHLESRAAGLLYIGVAWDLDRRLRQHRKTKSWWPEVYIIASFLYPSRQSALAAEAVGIRCDISPPIYNIMVPSKRTESMGDAEPLFGFDVLAGAL